jgi:hypothetical protein
MPNYNDWGSDFKWSDEKGKTNWGAVGSGALSGAATGTAIMPGVGTVVGGLVGGALGYFGNRGKTLSQAEQLAQNYDTLQNRGLKEFGAQSTGRGFQGIGDYADAVKNFQAQGAPNMSALGGTIGDAQRVAGKLERYSPERLDAERAEEKAYAANVNTNINPLALRQRKQADQASLLRKGNPNLSEYQRGTLNRQDRQGAEQAIAEQGVGMVEASRGRQAQMAGQADSLVNNALQAAMQGQLGIGQLQTIMAKLPMEYQGMLLSALGQIPGMYQNFTQQFNPNPNQYNAAQQGGKQGTDWAGLIGKGVDIYKSYQGGGSSRGGGGGGGIHSGGNYLGE